MLGQAIRRTRMHGHVPGDGYGLLAGEGAGGDGEAVNAYFHGRTGILPVIFWLPVTFLVTSPEAEGTRGLARCRSY
jgi:hypothetical protein